MVIDVRCYIILLLYIIYYTYYITIILLYYTYYYILYYTPPLIYSSLSPILSTSSSFPSFPFPILSSSVLFFLFSFLLLPQSLPPNIHSIRVGSSIYLLIFPSQYSQIWPRMFYRSGWLRCVGLNTWESCLIWCDVWWLCYYILYIYIYYYYIIHIHILLYYYIISILYSSLFWSILPSSSFPFPSSSDLSPILLFSSFPSPPSLLIPSSDLFSSPNHLIQSIRVGSSIRLFIFYQYRTIWPRTN